MLFSNKLSKEENEKLKKRKSINNKNSINDKDIEIIQKDIKRRIRELDEKIGKIDDKDWNIYGKKVNQLSIILNKFNDAADMGYNIETLYEKYESIRKSLIKCEKELLKEKDENSMER